MARGTKGGYVDSLTNRKNGVEEPKKRGRPNGSRKYKKRKWHFETELHLEEKWGREYRCGLCIYSSTNILDIRHHIEIHALENIYDCPDCGESFPVLSSLRRHRRIMHIKVFFCKICNKVFKSLETLRIHKKRHAKTRLFSCKTCKKVFRDPANIRAHKNLHGGCKPYVCETCEKAFIYKANFRRHTQTHGGD